MRKAVAFVLILAISLMLPLVSFGYNSDMYLNSYNNLNEMNMSLENNTQVDIALNTVTSIIKMISYAITCFYFILLVFVIIANRNLAKNGANKRNRCSLIILSIIFLILGILKINILHIILAIIALVFAIQSKKLMDTDKAKSKLKAASILLIVIVATDIILMPVTVALSSMISTLILSI